MELTTLPNLQYVYPVGIIIILALLVYVFGFRKAETPAFDQLSHSSHLLGDDRKPAGKRRKPKEKKTSNGHATFANNDQEDTKSKKSTDKSPNKTTNKKKQEPSPTKKDNKKVEEQKKVKKQETVKKENKQDNQKKENKQEILKKENKQEIQKKENKQEIQKKENNQEQNNKKTTKKPQDRVEEIKNKKNERNLAKLRAKEDKPTDFDEGEWEQAYSRKDKKKKIKEEPSKVTTPIQLFLTEEKEKEICVEKQVIKEEVKQPISEESAKVNSQNNKSKKSKSTKKNVSAEKVPAEKVPVEKVPVENAPVEIALAVNAHAEDASSVNAPTENAPAKKFAPKSSEKTPIDIEKPTLKANLEISEPKLDIVSSSKDEAVSSSKVEAVPSSKIEAVPSSKVETVPSSKVETEASSLPDVSKAPIIEKEDTTSSGVAFDELGEMWKEAAPTRKTKKKTRKE